MYRNSISLLLYVVHIASSFGARAISIDNVHVSQPIVRRSPATNINPDDMFGFAAIMHQIEVVNSGDSLDEAAGKTRIIVGAPSGTFPGGLNLADPGMPRAERSGLVYACPVQSGTCYGVRGNTTLYLGAPDAVDNNPCVDGQMLRDYPQSYIEGRLFDQAPSAFLFDFGEGTCILTENKTDQLLGATLFSNGETFMACAPRWTDTRRAAFTLLPRGVCYTSGRNLQGFQRLQPCVSSTAPPENTREDGYCLAGTSALAYDGGFVLGAPGNQEGRGSLFYSTSADIMNFMSGQFLLPNADGVSDLSITDQYQGFSTVAAFITLVRSSGPAPNIVAAVPRYDDNTYSGRITVYNPPDYQTIQSIEARGTQMAEFFGHSMIAIDINGDNYDDLIVGAPMNTDFDALEIERGRVYVFMNTGGGALMSNDPIIFDGPNPRGRFGTSLANLGDIDRDGNEDFAVGAPYTENNGNTGAIYIYYGNSNQTLFESQTPFEITASDVVNNITGLNELKTFGYSVSGGVDVDNNRFNDLVVGAYESQLVVLLRSLPVITVTVNMRVDAPTPVALDSTFPVSVTASYQGEGVNGRIDVSFTLSEVRSDTANSRLRFENNGEGTLTLMGPGRMDTQTVMITSLSNTTSLAPHMLRLTIPGGIDPPSTLTDGNATLVDLSPFPRLRLAGNNTLDVPVVDPCGGDGCQFDVELTSTTQTIEVVANADPISTVELMYTNAGPEDAVGLNLNFTGLSSYIRSVAIRREGAMPSETPCTAITNGVASCMLRTRFSPGSVSERVTVNFTIDQDSLTGSEPDFTVRVEVTSQTENSNDGDVDPSNNFVQLTFDIVARAEISITRLSFGGNRFDYTAVAPQTPVTVQGLGRSTITLEVDIQNAGPTTIREGNVTIYLANRITDTQYTLYPTRIVAVNNQNGIITCDRSFVNPDGLPLASQVGEARRRRSAYQSSSSSLKRVTRQENTVTHSCIGPTVDSGMCTVIRCSLTNLRRGNVPFTISIFTRIDERYFSTQPVPGTVYTLTSSASVSIMSSFYGDNTNDNSGMVTVMLAPMVAETPRSYSTSSSKGSEAFRSVRDVPEPLPQHIQRPQPAFRSVRDVPEPLPQHIQRPQPSNSQPDHCSDKETCGMCIGTAGCSWCSTLNFEGQRCSSNLTNCNGIEEAMGSIERELSDRKNPVDVTNVNLQLSVGVPQTFTVTVTPLRNLALDLYLLIDLSTSMMEELDSLKRVAGDIANRIRNITDNVRIGFGSFNDKPTRPYTYIPMPNAQGVCNIPLCNQQFYAFRHQITLTDNITFYNMSLQGVTVTENADRPENGLEGLAQVVACEDIIGWRSRDAPRGPEQGRTRVVLFMTDDAFHFAGEGQFAGILKPYRGECLLDPPPSDAGPAGATEFTRWSEVDYPSVGQIVQMLQQNEVAVIFAVQESRLRTYQNLSELINLHSRSSVAQLIPDGTNILNLINTEYESILQEVALVPDDSTELTISVQPMCPAGTTELPGGFGCNGVQLDTPVNFEISVTLNTCENFPSVGSPSRTHRIVSPTLGDFIITYTGDCVCDCAVNLMRTNNSALCNFNGDFVCGVCECFEGWCGSDCSLKIGDLCGCDRLTETCPRGGPNNLQCNGQGVCCEGSCICRQDDDGFFYRHSDSNNPERMDCACPPEEQVCREDPMNLTSRTCVNGTCGCQGCQCVGRAFGRFCDARDVGTCNDAMDLMCIERCVNSNFDENTCRTCERTRPILTLSSLPEGETLEVTLERVANTQLPADPRVNTTFQYDLVDCAAVVGRYTYKYYVLLRAGDMYALILDQEIEESTTAPATTVPSTTVTLPPTTIPATTVTVPPPQPPPPPGVQGLCSFVVWYSPVVESCEDICDIRGYEVRLYNPQSSHPNITNRVGANRTFYMVEEEKLPSSHETYVQVRVIHQTSQVGEWSEGISLGCEKPPVPEKPPRVHFELNGKVYLNNSALPLADIGEGTSALYCRTDKEECCGMLPNRFGQFYYPNGVQVPIANRLQGFYRNRGSQLIRLNRREGITSPTGTYRCEIPNDDDETVNIYITLTGN